MNRNIVITVLIIKCCNNKNDNNDIKIIKIWQKIFFKVQYYKSQNNYTYTKYKYIIRMHE